MSDLNLKSFFFFIVFCTPLYLVKTSFFGIPINILEILSLIAILMVFIKKRYLIFNIVKSFPWLFLISTGAIILGVFLSIIFNNNFSAGFGILKSWFIIPILFSFSLYLIIDAVSDVENIFKSIYFSMVCVGFFAIIYKAIGITTYDNRLSCFYDSPNQLAMYLAPGVFLGCYLLLTTYHKNRDSKRMLFYLFSLMLILIPLYYTYSYGAWLTILISLCMTFLVINPNKKQSLFGLLLLFIFTTFLFITERNTQKFSDALAVSPRSSLSSRLMIWNASLMLIENNPALGIGPGNFQENYLAVQKYFPPYLEWAVPQPHNIFLAFWLQAGALGLLGFLILLIFIFKTILEIGRNKKNAYRVALLFGFFLYIVLHGLIDTTYWKNDLAFLFWIFIFLTLFLREKQKLLTP